MGPIAIFDKSFIQALSLDESVWFDHFFSANVCPVFYIETLADIAKDFKGGNSPIREVQKIAARFPECSSYPCISHTQICIADLLGHKVPMNGQIPMAHSRPVATGGQTGVIFNESPEAEAFARCCRGEFDQLEKQLASAWRKSLSTLDLGSTGEQFRKAGISGKTCQSLSDVAPSLANLQPEPTINLNACLLCCCSLIFQGRHIRKSSIAGRTSTILHCLNSLHIQHTA